jgi:hypothetical protein
VTAADLIDASLDDYARIAVAVKVDPLKASPAKLWPRVASAADLPVLLVGYDTLDRWTSSRSSGSGRRALDFEQRVRAGATYADLLRHAGWLLAGARLPGARQPNATP